MIEPVVIRDGDRPTHVVIAWSDWERLRDLLEDEEDLRDAERIRSDPNTDWVPSEVVDAMLDDTHPVKAWRKHRGLTQAALAAAAGLPQPTIARIERGERIGTLDQMRRLAEALQVKLDTLATMLER